MASTPLLGLSLPADGTTNWGTLVNTSITALLDSAIAGTTTLSSDADVTLTTTTEAANEARQAILLCTGARTAVRTITAPAQSKTYVVINSTTGGYGVKIVGVGPTTGITVPSGATYMVAWNGSDFVVTKTTPVNLSTEVTGVLPIANGGTGASTLAGASIPTYSSTDTLSNKTIQARVVVIADATSITINGDTTDIATQENTQPAGTLTVNAPTGTPFNGQKLILRLRSTNVQTFSWNAIYRVIGTVLPTATVANKIIYVGFIYNSPDAFWDVVAVTTQA